MSNKDWVPPLPNSLEFAKLSIGQQRIILGERAIEAGLISHADLWRVEDDKPEAPTFWYYHTDDEALERWQNNTRLSRCTGLVSFNQQGV